MEANIKSDSSITLKLKKLKAIITKNQTSKIFSAAIALLILLIIVLVIAKIIDNNPSTPVTKTANIEITANGFLPATILVDKGTKIIWTNTDKKNHQVNSNPHPTNDALPGLNSEILNKDQTYEYTADQSGEFGYHDGQEPTKNATIQVK